MEELSAVRTDAARQADEMSDARIFSAMKEMVALVQSAGDRWPGMQIHLVKDGVLSGATSYTRYGMRIEIKDGARKHSVTAGVTTLTGGNALYNYLKDFTKTFKSSRGGVLLHPRHDFTLGKVGTALVKEVTDAGKLELLRLDTNRDMFVALEAALGLLKLAQENTLVLGTTAISYAQCQALMCETGVLNEMPFLQKLAKWNSPAAKSKPVGKKTEGADDDLFEDAELAMP
jgi:hypothetical protein